MRSAPACPGCGAVEGSYHADDCRTVPMGVRPCCYTPIWLDHFTPHVDDCPAGWGTRPVPNWQFPDLGRDPWRGL